MTDTVILELGDAMKAVDEAYELLETLAAREVTVWAGSVQRRREATSERAQVKADLSYVSHLLDMARVLVDHQHQTVTRTAKNAERKAG